MLYSNKYLSSMLWATLIFLMTFVAGCTDDLPTPQERFQSYISDWENQRFENMYAQLSTDTKARVTENEFVERYTAIYEGIRLTDLSISVQYPEEELNLEESEEIQFPIQVHMHTLAGSVEFEHMATLVHEERTTTEDETEEDWWVVWNEQMIFPQLEEEEDVVRVRTLPAERGEIRDRHENGLAINGEIISIGVVPEQMIEYQDSKQQVAELLDISVGEIEEAMNAPGVQPDWFVPITSLPEGDAQVEALMEIPGVLQQTTEARVYPYKEVAAHLTGYVGEITAEELEELEEEGYGRHDMLGKSGLERVFEERLKGQNGAEIYIEYADREDNETIARLEPTDGEDIQLTIDIHLQETIYERMNEDAGSAAAIDPTSGEVLALVNAPAYDPNTYILEPQGSSIRQEWSEDPQQPLLNRFTHTYSPGSAFKPITAAIALETGTITPEQSRNITGHEWQPDSSWGNYHVRRVTPLDHAVDVTDALVYSDNIYFAQTALEMGAETFVEEAKAFGFGERIPFAYPFYASQITNEETFSDDIQLADSGYGQGEILMSPLHLALTYTPFLNEGDLLAPSLELGHSDESVWKEGVMTADTAQVILDALIRVVEHPDGTGSDAQISGRTIAGKTGTAELKQSREDDNDDRQHGWFVGLDANDSQLLVVMMIEDVQDQGGSGYVVPKVREVLTQYME